MNSRVLSIVLSIALAFGLLILYSIARDRHLPGNHQGYEPEQPIAFSHRLHAGELGISCLYCHSGAETSRHAGTPTAETCMNCHQTVSNTFAATRVAQEIAADTEASKEGAPKQQSAPVSPELKKLYHALALDENRQPKDGQSPVSIPWERIHDLPDYVYFDHRAHVQAGVSCQQCHGPVETMERVRQVNRLSMGWCIQCHRDSNDKGIAGHAVNASLDCSACHY
jgi:hypothetical protein